jgi:putative aldouronate transport system substrate-binding protein
MSTKRIIALAVALVLMLSITACAPAATTSSGPTNTTATTKPSENTTATTADPYAEKVVISFNTIDAEKHGKSARDEFVANKFNVEFDYIPVTWGDWKEKVRAWVAADDMPDVLWWDMKIADTGEFKTWAEAGAFRAFPDDMSRWPNLVDTLATLTSDEALLTVDGKLYGMPATRRNPEWRMNTYYACATYRRDWAKAVGMYQPNDIYTWEQVKAMIREVQKQDPGKNGPGATLGLTAEAWAFPGPIMEGTGYTEPRSPYVRDANGKWVPRWATESFRDEVKHVVDLFREGYIWKDQMLASGSEGAQKFKSGLSFMHWGSSDAGWVKDYYDTLKAGGLINSTDDIGHILVLSPKDNKTFWLAQTEDYWSASHINHKVEDVKMERIFDIWNFMMDPDEGYPLRAFGIEGKDYSVNTDGSFKVLWEKDADGKFVNPYEGLQHNFFRTAGDNGAIKELANADTEALFENIHNYMKTNPNYRFHVLEWDIRAFDGPNFKKVGSYDSDMINKVKELCGNSEDVDAAWDKFIAEYLPKVQPVIDEFTAAFG